MALTWEYETTVKTRTGGEQPGYSHRVEIIDTQGGVSGDFCGTDEGVRLRTEGRSRSFYQTIQGSSLSFTMIIDGDTVVNFIEALANFDEKRFFVKYYRDGLLWFTGVILTEAVTTEYGNKVMREGASVQSGLYTVTAVDGITLLKEIAYNQSDGSAWVGYYTVAEIAGKCLTLMPTANQGQGQIWFTKWAPDTGGGNDFAQNVQIRGNNLFEESRQGGIKFFSCWNVLKIICEHFDIRIYYSFNQYWFEQINARVGGGDIYGYSLAGSPGGAGGSFVASSTAIDCDNRFILDPDRRTRAAPLRTVTTVYDFHIAVNLLAANKWENQTAQSDVCFTGLGPNVPITNNTTRLTFKGNIEFITSANSGTTTGWMRVVFFFKIKLGTQYYSRELKGTDYFNNYQNFEDEEWTTSAEYYVVPYHAHHIQPNDDGIKLYKPFFITTKHIPQSLDAESLEICFRHELYSWDDDAKEPVLVAPGDVQVEAWLKDGEIKVLDVDDNIVEDTQIVTSILNTVNNSRNIARELRFSDGPVYGDTRLVDASLVPVDVTEWTTPEGTYVHYEALARSLMARGMNTQEFFEGSICGKLTNTELIGYDSKAWIWLQGEYISGKETWVGEWMYLNLGNAAGLSKTTEEVQLTTGGPTGITVTGGAGLIPVCRVVYNVQKSIDVDAIGLPVPDTTNWTDDQIAARNEIYKQGVGMLRYVDGGTGVDEYYWNNTTRRIILGETTRTGDWTKLRTWI